MEKKKVVVIVGPTASGKSKLAIDVCKNLNGEVVSADSMQIYRGMDIGTAKAMPEEQQGIPHHLIDIIDPDENYSLDRFMRDCEVAVQDILSRGKLPVIVGGTGLYISSFINGVELSEAKVDNDYRDALEYIAETQGNLTLKQLLYGIDVESYRKLKTNDRKRIIRALEVYRASGKTISQLNEESKSCSKYDFRVFGLTAEDRDYLYNRINYRVDIMLENGLEEEARRLYSSDLSDTARQAIGYKELFSYLEGSQTLDEAVSELKQSSRNYAKRQITWFKKEKNISWYAIDKFNYENILTFTMDGIVK